MDKKAGGKGGSSSLSLHDPLFVEGPLEPGKKLKKREINMIDYEREA